jgi:hypothetical protein
MALDLQIEQAVREKIYAKIALMAPSGGGKTYSALRLATGMLEKLKELDPDGSKGLLKNGKIIMVNSESSRGRYYANEFTYDITDITAPFTPEKYVDYINEIVKLNYPILILDGTSPEWEGRGGCLELHRQAGGRYQDWGVVTPRHEKFLFAIADSPIHIIATMRGKDQYVMTSEEGNRSTVSVKKLGIGAKQREGFEYEFTASFLLDQATNMAIPQKDNTHLFENEGSFILTEVDGERIMEWANSGEGVYVAPKRFEEARADEDEISSMKALETIKEEIINMCKVLGGSKNKELMTILKVYDKKGNPNNITDLSMARKLYKELESKIGADNMYDDENPEESVEE